jgi:hypothetical protein
MSQIAGAPDPESMQPPLDYAPKVSPHETGVLNEEFGLEKRAPAPDSAETIIENRPVEESIADSDAAAR